MKNSTVFVLSILIIIVMLTGCNTMEFTNNTNEFKVSEILNDKVTEYETENSIDSIKQIRYPDKYYSIIIYKRDNKFGAAQFFVDKENLKYAGKSVKEVEVDSKEKDLTYFQFGDKSENHIIIFILNDDLAMRATDVYVEFKDNVKDEPHAIQISASNEKAVIITYSSRTGQREIETINLMKDGKDIFSKVIN